MGSCFAKRNGRCPLWVEIGLSYRENYGLTWHYSFPLGVSFPQRFGSITRSSQARECDNHVGASLSTAGTACFLLPRATQTFYKQFRGSHLENTVCLSYLRFQEVLASLCGWKQLESGVLVCTWQLDELNLFSHLRRLQAITPAWMSLLDNKTNDWQNSGDTACVVAYV